MVLSLEKSHFMCIDKEIDNTETLYFNDLAKNNCEEEEILEITLDRNMNFILILKIFVKKEVKNYSL